MSVQRPERLLENRRSYSFQNFGTAQHPDSNVAHLAGYIASREADDMLLAAYFPSQFAEADLVSPKSRDPFSPVRRTRKPASMEVSAMPMSRTRMASCLDPHKRRETEKRVVHRCLATSDLVLPRLRP